MSKDPLADVTTLAFDIFGTVLDLAGSLTPPIDGLLAEKGAPIDGRAFWEQWRARQRIEQYQDTLLMLGHSGYLETCRRALVYCLRENSIDFTRSEVARVMSSYQELDPFEDAVRGLKRLKGHYRLVALSNGDQWLLELIAADRIKSELDAVISVDQAGRFKPHPAVYRTAARVLGTEPHVIMMVASHSFDIVGARACGYRGAYVNRYDLPFGETSYLPDIEVSDFTELAQRLIPKDG